MNAQQIYRQALEALAAKGNAEASLAITLGIAAERESGTNIPQIVDSVTKRAKDIDAHLASALRHNDIHWTRDTDRAIERARAELVAMLGDVARA